MTASTQRQNAALRLWLLLPRVGYAFNLCLDLVFSKYGVSNEQVRLLSCIKALGPMRPIDLAPLLERGPNTISQLVDRMVKAGLVRRTRDRKDRRTVFVSLTTKGSEGVEPAIPAAWEFVNKFLSALSYDGQRTLADTLETLKCELTSYLNPEMDKAVIAKKSLTRDPALYERALKVLLPPGYQLKNKHRKK